MGISGRGTPSHDVGHARCHASRRLGQNQLQIAGPDPRRQRQGCQQGPCRWFEWRLLAAWLLEFRSSSSLSPCPVTPDGRGFITQGWSPGSRVDASCRLPGFLQWRVGRVLTAYSRGGGSGFASLIGSRLPNSHFSPKRFAHHGEPCRATMLHRRSCGQGRFRHAKPISRHANLG